MLKQKLKPIAIAVITMLTIQSCANNGSMQKIKETFNSDDPCANSKRNLGALIGGLTGVLVGKKVGIDNKVVAGALGAGIGALIGAVLDKRQCEISKIEKKYNANIEVVPISTSVEQSGTQANDANQPVKKEEPVGLSVNVIDTLGNAQFKTGSDEINPNARQMFVEIANQYKPMTADVNDSANQVLKNRRVLLIGHTDDTGSTKLNAELSEKRAKNVANIFKSVGVPVEQIYYQGAGETLPYADNETEEGRALNRRVEIVDLTDEDTFRLYLQNRPVNTQFYRTAEVKSTQVASKSAQSSTTKDAPSTELKKETKAKKSKKVKAESKEEIINKPSSSDSNSTIAKVTETISGWIDFGGVPASADNNVVSIGNQSKTKSKFSLINEAQASDITRISSCNMDRPRESGEVRSLKDGKAYSTSEYLPGVYNSSWAGQANGHLVALTNVAVLRDGNKIANKPNLLIYKDYRAGSGVKATFKDVPDVNVYRGDTAMLYRVFSDGPLKCMDVVIPNNNPKEAPNSKIQYLNNNTLYSASFNPTLAK